jgi:galactokinase
MSATRPRPTAAFVRVFGLPATTLASAPGRVNLIGEHTDYNDGLVLPTAIPQRTSVELALCDDGLVSVYSDELSRDGQPQSYRLGDEARQGDWLDYVRGITWALQQEGWARRLRGLRLHISSQVPVGSGLSSSAALLVSLLRGLRSALALPLSEVELARIARRAEVELVGAPVGIMDQLACALCGPGSALYLDTQSLAMQSVALPPSLDLIVIHSGVVHSHAAGEYRVRREECQQAAALLGVKSLRQLGVVDLATLAKLPEPLVRRVRHVVTENARVEEAVQALKQADGMRLGSLFSASHASLRDDYQVSVPALDRLVQLGEDDPAILGARLTGGGFGGSVVMLARAGESRVAAERIAHRYQVETGHNPTILVP